jgi:hypothetical protein
MKRKPFTEIMSASATNNTFGVFSISKNLFTARLPLTSKHLTSGGSAPVFALSLVRVHLRR